MESQPEESLYIFRLLKQELAIFVNKIRQDCADACHSLCAFHFVKVLFPLGKCFLFFSFLLGMILSLLSFA